MEEGIYVDECGGCEWHGMVECPLHYDSEEDSVAPISKETFMEMSTDSKLGVLFDYMSNIQHQAPKRVKDRDLKCQARQEACEKRFQAIETNARRTKIFNTGAAFIGGFVGGWSAVWTAFKLSLF